jgi:hypothetical protein
MKWITVIDPAGKDRNDQKSFRKTWGLENPEKSLQGEIGDGKLEFFNGA